MTHTIDSRGAAFDVEAEVERQKTRTLYGNAAVAYGATLVVAAILAFTHVVLHASTTTVLAWWCAIALSASGRYLLAFRFRRLRTTAFDAKKWQDVYVAATGLIGGVWGVGAIMFTWNAPESARLFTGLVIAGMMAGSLPILGAVPYAFRSFLLPVVTPMGVAVLGQASSPLDWTYAVMIAVFLVAMLVSVRYLGQTLDAAIRLGVEEQCLARNLEQARDVAEAALADRKRAESTLKASEERYRLILQYSPTGILHYDKNLVITYCNDRIAQLLQVPVERLIGLNMRSIKDQRVLPALLAALDGRNGSYEGEYLATLSGAQIWGSLSCAPLHGGDGGVEGAVAIIEDTSARHRSENEIRNLAYFDPLTRLPNRRLLMDRLGQAMTASNRSGEFGALMILDLDRFKGINDTRGHDVGDQLLIEVARRVSACLRQGDTVSRLGGDEFVVVLESLGETETVALSRAEAIAEKIRVAVSHPYALGGWEAAYFSTTSLGVTLFRGQGDIAEVLMKQADVALYQAKDAGRNAIRFFSPTMQTIVEQQSALEVALRHGLENNEFTLYYQPQVDSEGRLIGAEALVRWLTPDRGVVLPAQFVPLAEETGLILPLGRLVLDTACARLRAWQKRFPAGRMRLSVNVSARQFHQPDFVEQVRQSLLVNGADPTCLKLELTESIVLDHLETVIGRMRKLNGLGIGFSLDDFGTGYSSLSCLKRLPLEQVKIDQSFVRDIPRDANDSAIVRAILALSQSLGLQAIAEGVETEEQKFFLMGHGCHAYQGHYFSQPLSAEDFEEFASR